MGKDEQAIDGELRSFLGRASNLKTIADEQATNAIAAPHASSSSSSN